MKTQLLIGLLITCAAPQYSASAQPYIPASDREIVETLPLRGESWLEIQLLRKQAQAEPDKLPPTLRLVRRYIELGRAESDPRYFGYAEAALAPWSNGARANAEVLTLLATLYQNRHDFPAALHMLNQALAQQSRLAQAWLTRAAIYEVQGRYADAYQSCLPLLKLATLLVSQVCIESALSLSGQLDAAYRQLQQVVPAASSTTLQDKLWALTVLAEMAERLGHGDEADQYYRQALALGLRNGYLLAAYADFLLNSNRYAETVELLKNETRADILLLRLALAEHALQLPQATVHVDALAARFTAAHLRGDFSHQGDEARFMLHLQGQAAAALTLAQANWQVQHEPRDAKILLEAALAAGSPAAAQPVIKFLRDSGLQDTRLQTLIQRIERSRT